MAYEPMKLKLEDLPQTNLFRYAEIEMRYAFDILGPVLTQHTQGPKREVIAAFILDSILGVPKEAVQERSHFHDTTTTYTFLMPNKDELVQYLRFKNVSYNKITKLTGISPNTISAKRFDYSAKYPVWHYWTDERLTAWNAAKTALNLFGEKLYHS